MTVGPTDATAKPFLFKDVRYRTDGRIILVRIIIIKQDDGGIVSTIVGWTRIDGVLVQGINCGYGCNCNIITLGIPSQ